MPMSVSTAIDVLELHVRRNQPTCLLGPSGIGKSEIPKQLAERMGWPLIDWRANLRDPVDARGLPVPDMKTRTTEWLKPSELPIGGRHGKEGMLLLEEINTAGPAMQNVLLQMVLDRSAGEHKLDDGWVIVATANRQKDGAMGTRISTPLKSRFAWLEMAPDVKAFSTHALACGINPYLVAFIRFRPELLHKPPADDSIYAFPTPRTTFKVNAYLDLPSAIRRPAVETLAGYDYSVELEGFLRVCHEMPTLQEVLADPAKAKQPSQPAARYAVAAMLAKAATRKNFASIIEYSKLVDREFEMFTVVDATRHTPALKNTAEYGTWAVDNQSLLI